ncbi:MAG: hypothetical protein V4757_07440 [Pseudomonadota bacterium]
MLQYEKSIHGSYRDYRLHLRASELCATTTLGPKEAAERVFDEYCQGQNRKHNPQADFPETCLYLHLREKARRGHERAFHLNGYRIEDLRLMERDQIVFSKFLGEWVDRFRWVACEDETLNAAITAMWAAHDAESAIAAAPTNAAALQSEAARGRG